MHIVTLTAMNNGGAGMAARRLHDSFVAMGHTGALLSLEPAPDEPALPLDAASVSGAAAPLWIPMLLRHWERLSLAEKMRQGGAELFSDIAVGLHELSWMVREQLAAADVVHLHWMAGLLFSPELFGLLTGKKLVWTLHDMNPFTGGCHYHLTCRNFEAACGNCPLLPYSGPDDPSHANFQFKKALYPSLDLRVVAPSRWLAGQAAGSALLGDRPVTSIPNTHDTTAFRPLDREGLRQAYGIGADRLVVLLGSEYLLNPRKKLELAAEALRQAAANRPEAPVEVIIFGNGPSPDVGFPMRAVGVVKPAAMVELFNLADLFIHPSILDNLSNTLCEAQCCGTPVMCFDVGGNRETFLPGVSGVLVSDPSSESLAQAIQALLDAPDNLVTMRREAREFAVRRFDPSTVAAAYTEIFKAHCARPVRRNPQPETPAMLQANYTASLATGLDQIGQQVQTLNTQMRIAQEHMARLETRLNHQEILLASPRKLAKLFIHMLSRKFRSPQKTEKIPG